ncbi:Uncharacterised protein [uncultured Blautia sp.]|nr:Uncharacterised protein [uncultured Blautia sp.]
MRSPLILLLIVNKRKRGVSKFFLFLVEISMKYDII